MPVEHWMQFATFAEQRHFEYPKKGTYQGVFINANMVAHAPAGMAAFLQEKTAGARYLIDPLTHAFQHDPSAVAGNDGGPKSSIRSLAELYGSPVDGLVGKRPLRPSHLANDDVLKSFTQKCIEFQRDYLRSFMAGSSAAKYLDDEAAPPPYALVAPYFFLTETNYEEWLPIVERCAGAARQIVNVDDDSKLFASVVVSKGIISDSDAINRIVAALDPLGLDGFLVWVDDLNENTAGRVELRGLLDLCRGLRGPVQREVINLHGGYFSVLAAGNAGNGALTGVSHGPEFGEFRGVVPVGGGIPIARYYMPGLHARTRYLEAQRIVLDQGWLNSAASFHKSVCDCDACREVLYGNPDNFALFGESVVKAVSRRQGLVRIAFPTKEAKLRCLQHYLQRKRCEYEAASNRPKEELLQELIDNADAFADVAGDAGVDHLRLWRRVLLKNF